MPNYKWDLFSLLLIIAMHRGSSFFLCQHPWNWAYILLTEMRNNSKLQPLQLYVIKRYTVCINILDLWLGLGLESQGPGPRLHLYLHFAGQIDKKTQKHNTTWCSVSLRGPTHKNLEVIEKATYLIYQYFQSVLCCRWKGRPNIKLIDTCGSRLIASRQLLTISCS